MMRVIFFIVCLVFAGSSKSEDSLDFDKDVIKVLKNGCEYHGLIEIRKKHTIFKSKKNGMTPLHYSILTRKKTCVENVYRIFDRLNEKDFLGNTALIMAVVSEKKDIIDFLLSVKAEKHHNNNLGYNYYNLSNSRELFLKIENGCDHQEIKKFKNIKSAYIEPMLKDTALHWAVNFGDLECVKNVNSMFGGISIKNSINRTPLMDAITIKDVDKIRYLINQGAIIPEKYKSNKFVQMAISDGH